jgi:Holliday junction resolvase-like predicted endonuclease
MNNFNSANAAAGHDFEMAVAYHLKALGWTVTAGRCINKTKEIRHGIEIDLVATDPNGVEHTIECKGSPSDGLRAGGRRTDNIKKAIADAWFLRANKADDPHILYLSHMPDSGVALIQLQMALRFGLFTAARTPWGECMVDDGWIPSSGDDPGWQCPECEAICIQPATTHGCGEYPEDINYGGAA